MMNENACITREVILLRIETKVCNWIIKMMPFHKSTRHEDRRRLCVGVERNGQYLHCIVCPLHVYLCFFFVCFFFLFFSHTRNTNKHEATECEKFILLQFHSAQEPTSMCISVRILFSLHYTRCTFYVVTFNLHYAAALLFDLHM